MCKFIMVACDLHDKTMLLKIAGAARAPTRSRCAILRPAGGG